MSRGIGQWRQATLVEVWLRDGTVGYGECWGPPALVMAFASLISEAYVGKNLFQAFSVRHGMMQQFYHVSSGLHEALAGIDMALWDLRAKVQGVALNALLGGHRRDQVLAYASAGYFDEHDDQAAFERDLATALSSQFTAVKIKIGRGVEDDVRRSAAARRLVGPQGILLLDINGAYTPAIVADLEKAVHALDPYWLEEPLPPQDEAAYAHLRCGRKVALGEAFHDRHPFKRLIAAHAVDVVQPDLTKCGLSEALAIRTLAESFGVMISPHVWGGAVGLLAAVHFVAALPPHPWATDAVAPPLLELDRGENGLRDEINLTPPQTQDGHLVVPTAPGLGFTPDARAIARFKEVG